MTTENKQQSAPGSASSNLAAALARLNRALDELDKSADALGESTSKGQSVDEQVQRMADDRARLAQDLDAAEARAERLASANSEVSRRLVGAMEMVRSAINKSS